MRQKIPALLLTTGLLAACQTLDEQDGPPPPGERLQAHEVRDAVPRWDPPQSRGNPDQYTVDGRTYQVSRSADGYRETGVASWYGKKFHGRPTSSGEPYDMYRMTAAHRSLPIPGYVLVRNLDNGRTAVVRVNDRGPFRHDRILDLSYAAAVKLGMVTTGTARVEVSTIDVRNPNEPTPITAATVVEPAPVISRPPVQTVRPAPVYVQPERPPVAQPVAYAPPAVRAGYHVQMGAFSDPATAERLGSRLLSAGYPATVLAEGRRTLHKVRVGPYGSEADARVVLGQLARAGLGRGFIVRQR